MLELINVTKVFNPGKANEIIALMGLNLQISEGEFVVIVGPNGSGKSTLLNCISGRDFANEGDVIISGNHVTRLAEHQRSEWIARVFQNPLIGTASDLSILENFRLASLRTKSKSLNIGITEDFKINIREKVSVLGMGLEDKLHQPMGSLSGGQRQALTLLMAVTDDLQILLLDEPTAALDPRSAEAVMKTADKLINEYKLTAILITHNMKEAMSYGNRIIQMGEGRVLRDLNSTEKAQLDNANLYEWFF